MFDVKFSALFRLSAKRHIAVFTLSLKMDDAEGFTWTGYVPDRQSRTDEEKNRPHVPGEFIHF